MMCARDPCFRDTIATGFNRPITSHQSTPDPDPFSALGSATAETHDLAYMSDTDRIFSEKEHRPVEKSS